jgi:ABC-type phosphate/phosphonate transport system substrate-binding protein
MGCEETATFGGTDIERTGEISDIVQLAMQGHATYMASLSDGTRWYREIMIVNSEEAAQYLSELIELRAAQHNKDSVTFRTTEPEERGVYLLEKYLILPNWAD